MSDEGFLKRWARLKAQPEVAVPAQPAPPAVPAGPSAPGPGDARLTPAVEPVPAEESPALTIADAAALTADSDFSTFVAKNVDAAVRRLAMKKLFADPHFHGHDGLDIYMGDYNLPSPVSAGMLAEMSHNKNIFAKLDEVIEQVDALVGPAGQASPPPEASPEAPPEAPPIPEPPAPAPPPPDQEVA